MTIDPELLKNLPAGSVVIIIPPQANQPQPIEKEPSLEIKPAKIPTKKIELKEKDPDPDVSVSNPIEPSVSVGNPIEPVVQITGEVREGIRYFTKEGREFFSVYDFIAASGYGSFREEGKRKCHNVWHRICNHTPLFADSEERHMFVTSRTGEPINVRQTTPCLPTFLMGDIETLLQEFYGEPYEESSIEVVEEPKSVSNVVEFSSKQEIKKLEVVRIEKPAPYLYGNYTFNTPQEVAKTARQILNSIPESKTGYFLDKSSNEYLFMEALISKSPMGERMIAAKGSIKAIQVSRHIDGASNQFHVYLGNNNFKQVLKLANYLPSAQAPEQSLKKETVTDLIAGIF